MQGAGDALEPDRLYPLVSEGTNGFDGFQRGWSAWKPLLEAFYESKIL